MNDLRKISQVTVEQPFESQLPVVGGLVAWVRTRWNNVAARWYVQAHFQQQNQFNAAVANQSEQLDERLRQQDEDLMLLTKTVAELEAQVKQLTKRVADLEAGES